MLAGKTKFLAVGLKKEYPAVQEFGCFYFFGSTQVSFCFRAYCADFCMIWRRKGHTLPEKYNGDDGLRTLQK